MASNKNRIKNIAQFIEIFPTTSGKELEKIFGVSAATIVRAAKKYNVSKSEEYLHNIQSERTSNRIFSAEAKAKMSEKAKGRKMSDETKAKALATKKERGSIRRGKDNHNWKGGKPRWKRYEDPLYQTWRNAVLERDNYTCQHCKRACKKQEKGLAAHHIKPYATYPELRLDVSNGLTLCRSCHMKVHNRNLLPKQAIECACGCGTMISPEDPYGRPRRYVNGHGCRGRKKPEESIQKMRESQKGKVLTPEHRAKIAAGFRKGDPSKYKHSTMKEQNRQRINNHAIEFQGETKCIAEWSELTGIHHATITSRLRNGWTVEDALSTPASKRNSKRKVKKN